MLVDSHCHLNMLDLAEFNQNLNEVIKRAKEAGVSQMLSVSVEPSDHETLKRIAESYHEVLFSVGVHPNTELEHEVSEEDLLSYAHHAKCVAIGETGLDYYRTKGSQAIENQQTRFRTHIHVSKTSRKPLIIHTRQAAEDTLRIMQEESAHEAGGVMHCFGESFEVAQEAMAMNFYISFSGIITFKNASNIKEVAQKVPMERILIETDSPYLAPVPYRGKQNHPALVRHVAETISELKGLTFEEVAKITTRNFKACFRLGSKP